MHSSTSWQEWDAIGKGAGRAVNGDYFTSNQRLRGSTSCYLYLDLKAGGVTDPHSHPGQELLFVITGHVRLHLKSGVCVPLESSDIAHFNSEIDHWLESDTLAKVFVIRYYHLAGGLQRQIRRDIDELDQLSQKPSKSKAEDRLEIKRCQQRLLGWLVQGGRQATKPGTPEIERFADVVGLARLLDQYVKHEEQYRNPNRGRKGAKLSLKSLFGDDATAASQASRFLRLYALPEDRNNAEVLINEIVRVFGEHGITVPRTVLAPHLFPRWHYLIMLSGKSLNQAGPDQPRTAADAPAAKPPSIGWRRIPKKLETLFSDNNNRLNLFPEVALAASDMSMTFAQINPGTRCKFSVHPGFELLLPLSGKVVVEFEDPANHPAPVSASLGNPFPEFVVFDSSKSHRICNPGPNLAQVLLIRFYDYWESERKAEGGKIHRKGGRRRGR